MKYARKTIIAIGAALVAFGSGLPTTAHSDSKDRVWWPFQTNNGDGEGETKRLEAVKKFVEERTEAY